MLPATSRHFLPWHAVLPAGHPPVRCRLAAQTRTPRPYGLDHVQTACTFQPKVDNRMGGARQGDGTTGGGGFSRLRQEPRPFPPPLHDDLQTSHRHRPKKCWVVAVFGRMQMKHFDHLFDYGQSSLTRDLVKNCRINPSERPNSNKCGKR